MLMLAVLDLINLKSQVRGGWGHLLEGEPGLGFDPQRLENILEIEVQLLGDFLYFRITIKSPFAHKTYPWDQSQVPNKVNIQSLHILYWQKPKGLLFVFHHKQSCFYFRRPSPRCNRRPPSISFSRILSLDATEKFSKLDMKHRKAWRQRDSWDVLNLLHQLSALEHKIF